MMVMGDWWDWLSGRDVRQWSRKILRLKYPHVRGFSRKTYDAIVRGDLEIMDDNPQLDLIIEPEDGE
jgi:hypothetical protein